MSNITLRKGKLSKTFSHEEEVLNFILYDRAFGNTVTSNKKYL